MEHIQKTCGVIIFYLFAFPNLIFSQVSYSYPDNLPPGIVFLDKPPFEAHLAKHVKPFSQPPVILSVSNSTPVPGQPLTVTVTFCNKPPDLSFADLFYTTNYASGNPSWKIARMKKKTSFGSCVIATYPETFGIFSTYEGIIPAGSNTSGTQVHYGIQAFDCDKDEATFRFCNGVVTNRSPKSGPGWPEGGTFHNSLASLFGETNVFGFPVLNESAFAQSQHLDISTFHAGASTVTSTPGLYFRINPLKQFIPTSPSFSSPSQREPVYLLFIQSVRSPDFPETLVPEGQSVLGYFPNVYSNFSWLGPFMQISSGAFFVDLEKSYRLDCDAFNTCPASLPSSFLHTSQSGSVFFHISYSAVFKSGIGGESGDFLVSAASGNVYLSSIYIPLSNPITLTIYGATILTISGLNLNYFWTDVEDLTNTVRWYVKDWPKKYVVQ